MRKLGWLWLLLLIGLFLFLARPGSAWTEMKRSWARREWIVTMLLVIVIGYLLYGVFLFFRDNPMQLG